MTSLPRGVARVRLHSSFRRPPELAKRVEGLTLLCPALVPKAWVRARSGRAAPGRRASPARLVRHSRCGASHLQQCFNRYARGVPTAQALESNSIPLPEALLRPCDAALRGVEGFITFPLISPGLTANPHSPINGLFTPLSPEPSSPLDGSNNFRPPLLGVTSLPPGGIDIFCQPLPCRNFLPP